MADQDRAQTAYELERVRRDRASIDDLGYMEGDWYGNVMPFLAERTYCGQSVPASFVREGRDLLALEHDLTEHVNQEVYPDVETLAARTSMDSCSLHIFLNAHLRGLLTQERWLELNEQARHLRATTHRKAYRSFANQVRNYHDSFARYLEACLEGS